MDHKVLQSKTQNNHKPNNSLVWDCGSSLYDSFELKSFERQLHSAISSRTLSMPRLSDHHHPPPLSSPQQPPQPISKKSSKFSRSGSGDGISPEFKLAAAAAVIRKSASERFTATTSVDL
ncbi:hypothetical protein CsSME_00009409 [Camellia sinensis var. sinensis]